MSERFATIVGNWAESQKVAMEAIFKDATQNMIDFMLIPVAMGGSMPVDTGFLRASLVASEDEMPLIREDARPVPGRTYQPDGKATAVLLGMEASAQGARIYFGFVAAYAAFQNYGVMGRPGRLFVEKAIQLWPDFVRASEADLAARLSGGGDSGEPR